MEEAKTVGSEKCLRSRSGLTMSPFLTWTCFLKPVFHLQNLSANPMGSFLSGVPMTVVIIITTSNALENRESKGNFGCLSLRKGKHFWESPGKRL